MVLSNKKLKQKLRAVKAELIVASEAENNLTDKNFGNSGSLDSNASRSLSTILNPEAQKSRLSKRDKRRQKKAQNENSHVLKNGETSGDAEPKKQNESKLDSQELKKKRKRKRDESEASENVEEKKPKQMKKKKKKKKKKKSKKAETGNVKEEGVEQSGSGAVVEQIVAMTNESNQSKTAEVSDKVYVGGIPYYSTEDDIRSFFEGCGTITNVDCMTFPDSGKFRGIAIITFKTEAAAKRALALDGSDMGGLFLKIQPFKSARVNKSSNFSPSVTEGYNRIYIGNLSWDVTEDDLRELFADCTVKSIRFGEDKETGEFKGYAHVDFGDSLSLNVALKLDQKVVCGRPVRISCAVPKKATVTNFESTNLKLAPIHNQVCSSNVTQVDEIRVTASSEAIGAGSKVTASSEAIGASAKVTADSEANGAGAKVTATSEANAVNSKIRRRTCYECGERGHISSLCPKKKADESTNTGRSTNDVNAEVAASTEADGVGAKVTASNEMNAISAKFTTNSEANAVSSKIRRRTCYECGERGHISSLCPKKKGDESTNTGAT